MRLSYQMGDFWLFMMGHYNNTLFGVAHWWSRSSTSNWLIQSLIPDNNGPISNFSFDLNVHFVAIFMKKSWECVPSKMRSHAWVRAFHGLYNAYFAVYLPLLALCFCIGISRVVYWRRELQTCPWRNFFVTDPKEKLEKYNPLCSFLSVFLLVKWKLTFSSFS